MISILLSLVVVISLFAFLSTSRMHKIDPNEESAQGRIWSWSHGMQMFDSSRLFGIGKYTYMEYCPLVAHNSVVQNFAEIGFVGTFFWLALLYNNIRINRYVLLHSKNIYCAEVVEC